MADDRKYRQRGYQDDGPRERRPEGERKPPEPRDPRMPRDPKVPNLPGFRQVFRCARCGNLLSVPVGLLDSCAKCGVDLHSCIQCVSFDTSARWECTENDKLPARVAPKDERNTCTLFTPRTTVERQTSTPSGGKEGPSSPAGNTSSARRAFDDLFK